MTAFAVKHRVGYNGQGPLVSILSEVQKQPYSFTNKKWAAELAAKGGNIYVIEVITGSGGKKIYRLGYRYKANECESAPARLWKDNFKFKNFANSSFAHDGIYFAHPVNISDPSFVEWFKSAIGMTEIPATHVATLERLILDPANNARTI